MKKYFIIAILGLYFCNSALALSFGAPPVIPIDEKQAQEEQEAVTNLINQNHKRLEEKHYCLSFNFVRKQGVVFETLIYECTECKDQVQILPPDTIENKIADNKRRMELEKLVLDFGNIRNELNPQNPIQERALKEALRYRYNNPLNPVCDPNKEYIGTLDDLPELAELMKEEFSFEHDSHFGRDVASLKPFSLNEMIYELENGNPNGFYIFLWDQYHQDNKENTFGIDTVLMGHWVKIEDPIDQLRQLHKMKEKGIKNVKFVNTQGDEVVYDLKTGEIDKSELMGTSNKGETGAYSTLFGNHKKKDIDPNNTKAIEGNPYTRDGDQYKYVGILYERDKKYPDKYYIINGQTGERMTAKQAYEFATTVSDMYVDDSPYQSVIDPLDPQYEEHLNYHKNQNSVFGK